MVLEHSNINFDDTVIQEIASEKDLIKLFHGLINNKFNLWIEKELHGENNSHVRYIESICNVENSKIKKIIINLEDVFFSNDFIQAIIDKIIEISPKEISQCDDLLSINKKIQKHTNQHRGIIKDIKSFFGSLKSLNVHIILFIPNFDFYITRLTSRDYFLLIELSKSVYYFSVLITSESYKKSIKADVDYAESFINKFEPLERSLLSESEFERYFSELGNNLKKQDIGYTLENEEKLLIKQTLKYSRSACIIFFDEFTSKAEFYIDNLNEFIHKLLAKISNAKVKQSSEIDYTNNRKPTEEKNLETDFGPDTGTDNENLDMHKLSKEQFKEFQRLLMEVYRTREELAIFVRLALNENINVFAGSNDLQTKTYQLIDWAEAKGRVINLIEEFQEQNKDNKAIDKLISSIKEPESEMKNIENNKTDNLTDETKILELRKQYLELSGKTDIKFNPKDELEEVKNKIKYLTK